jgi:hypothetical protein
VFCVVLGPLANQPNPFLFCTAPTRTPSCHVNVGANTEEDIETAGLSSEAFEQMLKEKVAKGLTLERAHVGNNEDRELPVSTVEARKYVKYMDDGF